MWNSACRPLYARDNARLVLTWTIAVTDYLNVVQYYNLHADKLKDVDKLLLSDLKGNPRQLLSQAHY